MKRSVCKSTCKSMESRLWTLGSLKASDITAQGASLGWWGPRDASFLKSHIIAQGESVG